MATPAAPQFDPAAYKRGTREQWQNAAESWHRWGPQLESWLGPATEVMLDLARVGPGSQVLDVAAGGGGQTLAAARRAGPRGAVLATDISPAILEFAEAEAERAGLSNVTTKEMDGEHLDVPAESFDAVISRVGLIYFPDQQAALKGMKNALRKDGRFFSVPVSIIRRRANLPPPLPGQPGPFSLGAAGVLQHAFEQAGFREVELKVVEAPLRMASAAECARFERECFGALHQMLSSLPESEREEAWAEIETALGEFEGPGGFSGPCELIVGAATR
jgi:ubiquinone/menaquinone biosynthesis C-methylase UbiE